MRFRLPTEAMIGFSAARILQTSELEPQVLHHRHLIRLRRIIVTGLCVAASFHSVVLIFLHLLL